MLGVYSCNRSHSRAIMLSSKSDEAIERFSSIAVGMLRIRPERVLVTRRGEMTTVLFYNSAIRRLFDKALKRRSHLFKWRNAYAASYIAALFDCNGGIDSYGLYIKEASVDDEALLEHLSFHSDRRGGRCYIINGNTLIAFIRDYSLIAKRFIRQPGNERDPC